MKPNTGFWLAPIEAGPAMLAAGEKAIHTRPVQRAEAAWWAMRDAAARDYPAPSAPDELKAACRRMIDDHQTSDGHHPRHVLVLKADFDAMTEALSRASAPMEAVAWLVSWKFEPEDRNNGRGNGSQIIRDRSALADRIALLKSAPYPVAEVEVQALAVTPTQGAPYRCPVCDCLSADGKAVFPAQPAGAASPMIDSECVHPACGCGEGPCKATGGTTQPGDA